ncbi:hypothetical protein B296_00035796 [Ensete ventricosum]|uniref:Uncharacterized protein n=1 Tax=Ensete ventricosum TaxID=4639 RepID=A0A426X8W3_ENSVE|nr:hypothetical protein B296_00035796 [Ensete ventricosum]
MHGTKGSNRNRVERLRSVNDAANGQADAGRSSVEAVASSDSRTRRQPHQATAAHRGSRIKRRPHAEAAACSRGCASDGRTGHSHALAAAKEKEVRVFS